MPVYTPLTEVVAQRDIVVTSTMNLPELCVGDWIYFTSVGAYTASLASCYSGHKKPQNLYIWSDESGAHTTPAGSAATTPTAASM